MKKHLLILLIVFFCLGHFTVEGQFIFNNRPAIWPSLSIQKKIGDHWKLKAEHSTRLKFMPFMVDELYLQAGAEYAIRHNISVELNYRFSESWSPERHFMPGHRILLEADFSTNIKRLGISFHPAVQAVFSRENIMDNMNPLWCFRPKIGLKYNIRKTSLEPFGSLEVFLGRKPQSSFDIYKYRLSLGIGYKLTEHIRIDGYIRQQGGFDSNDASSYSILGVDLGWRF